MHSVNSCQMMTRINLMKPVVYCLRKLWLQHNCHTAFSGVPPFIWRNARACREERETLHGVII